MQAVRSIFSAIALMAALVVSGVARAATVDELTTAMRDDAELLDVSFADAEHGWAVGDRGAIWHTLDGGQHWEPQESGVACRLSAVQFVDPKRGWAAGGSIEPYAHVSRGVLLMTRDGGRNWTVTPQPLLGTVLRLKFFDAKRGAMLTLPTPFVPSGLLTTDDGGQDWTPVPQSDGTVWSCADFADLQRGVLASDNALASFDHGAVRPERAAARRLRRPAQVRLATSGRAYAMGEGGLLLARGGDPPQWAPCKSLPDVAATIDFQAIATRDSHVWLAGSPGSTILHSADDGQHWDAVYTSTTLPIQALTFVDPMRGWAVGACGQIRATTDGGKTWKTQRGAGRRAAYLAVFAEPDDVPLELLARLSAGEGYYGTVLTLTRRDLESPAKPPLVQGLAQREALIAAGASGLSRAWQFPVRQSGLGISLQATLDNWRNADGADPQQRLEESIARAIRIWRPEVVVVSGSTATGNELCPLVHRAVLGGVKLAALAKRRTDSSAAPEPAPWKVRRVFSTLRADQLGQVSIAGSQLLPQLGRSLSDYVATARGVLSDESPVPLAGVTLQVAWDESGETAGFRDIFAGLVVPHGSEARRVAYGETTATVEQLRRAADRRQVLQAIITRGGARPGNRAAWLTQVGALTSDLDDESAAGLLYQLGCRYRDAGQWDLAADTFSQLAEKYSAQSAASAAALWLLQYNASGETAVRAVHEGKMPVAAQATTGAVAPLDGKLPWRHGAATPIPTTADSQSGGPVQPGSPFQQGSAAQTSAVEPPNINAPRDGAKNAELNSDRSGIMAARRRLAAQWSEKLEAMSPLLAAEPWAVFPRIHAQPAADKPGRADRLVLGLMRSRSGDPWWASAAGEQWLADPRRGETGPKPIWHCRRAAEKPNLDGRLDDPCWQADPAGKAASSVELHSPLGDDAAWPAVAQLAYDDEFLYVGVICRQAPGVNYDAAAPPRSRDADLAAHDRVALTLDIDRDCISYWRLQMDHRGLTADDCWGDATWNPQWFVSAAAQKGAWVCEAAIPWSELASHPPRAGEAWGVGLTRIVPGVGLQSFSKPAAAAKVRGEGFGYLLFD